MPLPVLSSRSVISGVSAFQINARPVFRVKLQDGTSVVLKGEIQSQSRTVAQVQQSIQLSGRMMQLATPGLQTEILTPAEVAVLKSLNPAQLPFAVRTYLVMCLDNNIFYKMPFLEGIRDAEGMFGDGKAAKLLGKLKGDAPAIQGLGKIVAVDLFVGNSDRFSTSGGINNSGNLLFVKNLDKSYTAVGLDFYEAMGRASNLVTPPPASEASNHRKGLTMIHWGGPILMNENTRRIFASKCILSMNNMFRMELQQAGPVNPMSLLGLPDETAFAAGMAEGVKELRAYLTKKAGKGKLPQGVLDRMSLLNWTWAAAAAPARPAGAVPGSPGFVQNGFFFETR